MIRVGGGGSAGGLRGLVDTGLRSDTWKAGWTFNEGEA